MMYWPCSKFSESKSSGPKFNNLWYMETNYDKRFSKTPVEERSVLLLPELVIHV